MIVDACARVWQGAESWAVAAGHRPATSGELRSAMDGLGCALVVGYRSTRLGALVEHDRVAEWVRETPSARVGFAGVDPSAGDALAVAESALQLRLQGVTIAPADCGCRPTQDSCMALMEWCAQRGVPVIVSNPGLRTARSVLEFANPALFDDALREIKGLRVVFGDLGRAYRDEALAMIAKHAGAFAEISTVVRRAGMLYQTLLAAHERDVLAKMLFGSGFPAESPQKAVERIYSINVGASSGSGASGGGSWPTIPRELLRGMVERDAVALLGLDPLPAQVDRRGANAEKLTKSVRRLEIGHSA